MAISSAITSYSRIYMSQFKNNPNYNLFYTDTDSIYINKPLDESLVSSNVLGKLELESINDKAIFLSPKVYCLLSNNQIISKVKGLRENEISKLKMDDFEKLLYKDSSLKINHEKHFKSLKDATVEVRKQIYTLKCTSNKRELIYDDNKLINTKAYRINNDEIIKDV